jgi:hypothetical protein
MGDQMSAPVIACNLDAAGLAQRQQPLAQLLARATERRELNNGFAYVFVGNATTLSELAEAIEPERRCCPFFRFLIVAEPDGGPITLELTGPEGTKEFIESLTTR